MSEKENGLKKQLFILYTTTFFMILIGFNSPQSFFLSLVKNPIALIVVMIHFDNITTYPVADSMISRGQVQ